jgi:hypothetical protein
MEENKYISNINSTGHVAICLSSLGFIYVFYIIYRPISFLVLILLVFLIAYMLLAIYQSLYYFYDDKIVRIFSFRPFLRKTIFEYEKIYKIKYHHIGSKGSYPKFIIYLGKRQYFKYFKTFVFKKHVQRVEIVEFLLSKNVEIEVRTDFEKKDKEIIDLVKEKYPKNIRLYP